MATASKPTKAFEVDGIVRKGHFKLGMWGGARGSPSQVVHDGDTVSLNTPLNFSSRFLGIDTPEVSFTIRTKKTFISIGDTAWQTFWTTSAWKTMPLAPALRAHLETRIGDGSLVAQNHAKLAKQAELSLTKMINDDIEASGKTREEFEFFLAFSYEFLDQYGRMLCYLNAERSLFTAPASANALSYNERQLANGAAVPYFIFPNLQPFLSGRPFDAASINPAGFWHAVNAATRLTQARQAVAAARAAGLGVFNGAEPLIVLPYELRFLARLGSTGPDRFVIDLGDPGSNKIFKPEDYFMIDKVEDRLFIPREFVPLFTLNGWQIQ